MTFADPDRTRLPTDEDVAFYREHGWYVSPSILPDELLDDALHGAERHYAGERDMPLPLSGGYLDWREEHGNLLRLNDYVSLQNEQLRALVAYPLIGAIAARLAGTHTIRLFHDQLVCKPPHIPGDNTAIGWHTDRAYWHTCTSTSMLTAWIPFQDCTVEMGPLMVVDGSHRWPGSDGMRTFNDRDLDRLEKSFQTNGAPVKKVTQVLRKGQVSFHHCLTLHGSLPNRSQKTRLALTVHMQDGDNRYRTRLDAQGRPLLHINDILCRRGPDGLPDYSDPEVCPVLWRQSA
jgi:ectoine hydroxylase-related dioxygenase (phytanoyl-CoA dioxygenase family)